jgi:hypothetical protein
MFKRLVMLVRGLMGNQSMAPSTLQVEQPSPSAKRLRAKSTQVSPQAAPNPAKLKPKRKSKAAQAVTTAPSQKAAPKPAQMESGNLGLLLKTPASQPAPQSPKRKPSAAQPTTQVKSRKQTLKPAQTISGKDGLQAQTPAFPIRLPVKPAVKAKAARVPSIKAALLSQLEQVPALTRTEIQSGALGQVKATARKTRQPVSQVQTPKQKAADSTLAGKKATRSKTSVQTRTVRPSKVSGS